MEIRVDNLADGPYRLTFEEPLANLPLLSEWSAEGEATFAGSLSGELVVRRSGRMIEVEGTLSCTLGLTCSRCLQPLARELVLPVELSFERQSPPAGVELERELSEAELGVIPFAGDILDLREPLEQEVLMGIPQHPLCRDDCAGLCPVCGGDRNRQSCQCPPPVFHGGLAALGRLKVDR